MIESDFELSTADELAHIYRQDELRRLLNDAPRVEAALDALLEAGIGCGYGIPLG